jgi:SAM-dependent methyltransferase
VLDSVRLFLRRALRRALPHVHGELLELPFITGKVVPVRQGAEGYVLPPPDGWGPPRTGDDGLPIPPEWLWLGYADTAPDFLESGRRDVATMSSLLREGGAAPESMARVLDLGCGAARMLRFFPGDGDRVERWGADISATHIAWCQEHLDPPFRFVTVSTAPHLPFPDAHFDLVYCASVFTHIADLPDAWLLEILRVVRPGGFVYVTLHDQHTVKWLLSDQRGRARLAPLRAALQRFDEETSVLSRPFTVFSIGSGPDAQVFHDSDRLARRWERVATVLSVTPHAHDHQTAMLLRRDRH